MNFSCLRNLGLLRARGFPKSRDLELLLRCLGGRGSRRGGSSCCVGSSGGDKRNDVRLRLLPIELDR